LRRAAGNGAATRPAQAATEPAFRLGVNDILDLGILGLTALQPMTATGLVSHLRCLGRPLFTPTAEVVGGRIDALTDDGLIEAVRHRRAALLRPTAAGRAWLRRLLCRPDGGESAAQRDQLFQLRISLLDLVDAADRAEVLRDLAQQRRVDLAAAEVAMQTWRANGRYSRLWLRRQVERINADLAWLERLAAQPPESAPASPLARHA
jgi:DNA-binding PadR family transcriptional regulator